MCWVVHGEHRLTYRQNAHQDIQIYNGIHIYCRHRFYFHLLSTVIFLICAVALMSSDGSRNLWLSCDRNLLLFHWACAPVNENFCVTKSQTQVVSHNQSSQCTEQRLSNSDGPDQKLTAFWGGMQKVSLAAVGAATSRSRTQAKQWVEMGDGWS